MSYRVYFGRLPETLSQDEFEKMLDQHGKAKNIDWKSGYAYVDYKHGSDASKTVQNLNGKEIGGNNILVELARNGGGGYSVAGGFSVSKPLPRPVRTPHRLRIENLSTRAKWMELKELLSMAGAVTFADTHKRKQGEGIVEFGNHRDMREAIRMFDKTVFFGKTIRLYDESPRSRRDSRSRSRSRSRRRSSPSSKDRRRKSRSRSVDRKRSDRRPETRKKIRSKSASPRRKSGKQKRSKSPSSSPSRRTSRKHRSRSTTPPKHPRSLHKKSRKSHSQSKSPKRNKHEKSKKYKKRKKSYSSSSPDNDSDSKPKAKTGNEKRKSSSESGSSSSSGEGLDSDHK